MDCHHFDRLLDSLLEGRCAPSEWSRAQEHMRECPRCRQLFDALGGRSDTLDEAGHASLTAAIVARTSGSPCGAAHDRLCDFVDGRLAAVDRELVEGHLAHCQPCHALAGALGQTTVVLPRFAEIDPPESLFDRVLAATSRRPHAPSPWEMVASWLGRAAMRPRFSVKVAYAFTLLIILAVGDPVRAVRGPVERGAVYMQPRVEAVGEQFAAALGGAMTLGARTIGSVASVTKRPEASPPRWDAGLTAVREWFSTNVDAPMRAVLERAAQWIRVTVEALSRLVRRPPPHDVPNARQARVVEAPAEPFAPALR